jgi:hypothetical protein
MVLGSACVGWLIASDVGQRTTGTWLTPRVAAVLGAELLAVVLREADEEVVVAALATLTIEHGKLIVKRPPPVNVTRV